MGWFYLQITVLLSLPAFLAGIATFVASTQINRPWVYFLVLAAVLFGVLLVYGIVVLVIFPGDASNFVPADVNGHPPGGAPSFVIPELVKPMLLLAAVTLPLAFALLKIWGTEK